MCNQCNNNDHLNNIYSRNIIIIPSIRYRKILEIAAKRNYGDVVKEILSRNYPEIQVLSWEAKEKEYQNLYDEGDKTILAIAESIETLQNRNGSG